MVFFYVVGVVVLVKVSGIEDLEEIINIIKKFVRVVKEDLLNYFGVG